MKTEITISFDADCLDGFTDEYLACLWAVVQANPAPMEMLEPGRLAAKVGFEIIRRWLKQNPLPLYHHQADHAARQALARHNLGKWVDGEFVPNVAPMADAPSEVHP